VVGEDDAVCVGVWLDGVVGIVRVCVSKTEVLNESGLLGRWLILKDSCNDNDIVGHSSKR
jgi:hypothetical protein